VELRPGYPTPEHERAAQAALAFFVDSGRAQAVLLTCSCARGKASADSCLDMSVLVSPDLGQVEREQLEQAWETYYAQAEVFKALQRAGKYANVEPWITNGCFTPGHHGWTTGPDEFELEIGNALVYSVPLWQGSDYLAQLKARWLPYYDEELRRARLADTRRFCINNLEHILVYVPRGLYFQSLFRLTNAFREFMQALFMTRRTYPIAYDKWIREQVEEILGLPELYTLLPRLFEVTHFESDELMGKAQTLRALLDQYAGG
jgi:hypothetical protein